MTHAYVFILECPRLGTTLLQSMVNGRSQIAITSEAGWVAECFEEGRGVTTRGMVTPELISYLLNNPRFARLHIGREKLIALMQDGGPVSYPSFVTGISDQYGRRKRKAYHSRSARLEVTDAGCRCRAVRSGRRRAAR